MPMSPRAAPAACRRSCADPVVQDLSEYGCGTLMHLVRLEAEPVLGQHGVELVDLRDGHPLKLAVDARRVEDRWEVFTHGGRKNTGLDAVGWARQMAEHGAGEILLTSMARDGAKTGFDLALTRAVSEAVPR